MQNAIWTDESQVHNWGLRATYFSTSQHYANAVVGCAEYTRGGEIYVYFGVCADIYIHFPHAEGQPSCIQTASLNSQSPPTLFYIQMSQSHATHNYLAPKTPLMLCAIDRKSVV